MSTLEAIVTPLGWILRGKRDRGGIGRALIFVYELFLPQSLVSVQIRGAELT